MAVGAPLTGVLSDRIVVKWRKRRGGKWVPEDRLRACLPGAMVFVPVSMVGLALALRLVDGTPGLILCLVCFFINGLGASIIYTLSVGNLADCGFRLILS